MHVGSVESRGSPSGAHPALQTGKGTAGPLNLPDLGGTRARAETSFLWPREDGVKRLNAPFSLLPYFKSLLTVSPSRVFISLTVFQARWNKRPVLKRNHSTL